MYQRSWLRRNPKPKISKRVWRGQISFYVSKIRENGLFLWNHRPVKFEIESCIQTSKLQNSSPALNLTMKKTLTNIIIYFYYLRWILSFFLFLSLSLLSIQLSFSILYVHSLSFTWRFFHSPSIHSSYDVCRVLFVSLCFMGSGWLVLFSGIRSLLTFLLLLDVMSICRKMYTKSRVLAWRRQWGEGGTVDIECPPPTPDED